MGAFRSSLTLVGVVGLLAFAGCDGDDDEHAPGHAGSSGHSGAAAGGVAGGGGKGYAGRPSPQGGEGNEAGAHATSGRGGTGGTGGTSGGTAEGGGMAEGGSIGQAAASGEAGSGGSVAAGGRGGGTTTGGTAGGPSGGAAGGGAGGEDQLGGASGAAEAGEAGMSGATGGTSNGTGGTNTGTGGTGGTGNGAGGTTTGAGGSSNGAGGTATGSGGTGGTDTGAGGTTGGTGGTDTGAGGTTGGTDTGAGGTTGGTDTGAGGTTGGTDTGAGGTGGTDTGAGGTDTGAGGTTGGTSAGSGGTSAGSGGTSAGSGGTSAGSGGTSAGSGGTTGGGAGTGGGTCSGAACTCILVAPDGDDALAATSGGLSPFRNVQPAIDYADAHRSGPLDVCVAQGASCGSTATYPGPTGADLTMRDGVSLYGGYESTTWSRCSAGGTKLAPGTANGVTFGADVQSETVLDRFAIARFVAATTAGITLDGAHGAVVSTVDVGSAAIGATTTVGVDARNGAQATLSGITMSVQSPGGQPWSPPHQFGIRATGSKLLVVGGQISMLASSTVGQAQDVVGVSLVNAAGSSVTNASIQLFGNVSVLGIHAENTAGIALDGTSVTIAGDGFSTPFGAIGAELIDSPDASWTGATVSIASQTTEDGILLDGSPGADIDAAVTASGNADGVSDGIRISGDATGTSVKGSVTLHTPPHVAGIVVEDCAGATPSIGASVDVVASQTLGEGIHVSGTCAPTISSTVTVRSAPTNHALTLSGIHCLGASRCTIQNATVTIPGATTTPGAVVTANGVLCDSGSCVSITGSHVSGLSTPGELRNSRYSGTGVTAPGATLISDNVIGAGCSGGNGVGLISSGRIENNVIAGPTCGGSFLDGTSRAVGLQISGNADVHSNTIDGGGALDGIAFGQAGCKSYGVELASGTTTFRNNIARSNTCGVRAAFARDAPAPTPSALENNDLDSSTLYLDGSTPLTTVAAVNGLANASGNFSADPLLDSTSHLTTGSPCIDAGTATGAPTHDFEGDLRDASPDVGADEWTGA